MASPKPMEPAHFAALLDAGAIRPAELVEDVWIRNLAIIKDPVSGRPYTRTMRLQ